MAIKLTDEMRSEIAAHPGEAVPVIDASDRQGAGGASFFLVPEAKLTHLEAVAGEVSQATLARLRGMIEEADAAPDIPANEFRDRVRAMAKQRGLPPA